jgi:AcrR family transcriptional regulator
MSVRSTSATRVRREGRRERRRAEERLRILQAAAHAFRRHGFAAAGMREIGAEADLSAANLYHYFRSKEEILFFCQDRTLDRLLEILEVARRARGSLRGRLHRLAESHVLCLIDEVAGSTAHLEVDALAPGLRDTIVAKRDRYERGIRALFVAGIRRGELRSCDAIVATRAFLGALNWTANWFRPDGPHTTAQVASEIADYAVAGLAGGRRSPRAR